MEGKTKKSFRFNIIDAIIILFILFAGAAAVYFLLFRGIGNAESKNFTAEYVIESKEIRSEFVNLIKTGDKIIDSQKNEIIGEIISVEYTPSTRTTVNTVTGELIKSTVPERYDVYITISSDDVSYSGNYKIAETVDLFVGSDFSYIVPSYEGVGSCISMNIFEK